MRPTYRSTHPCVKSKSIHRRITQVQLPTIKWVFKSDLSQTAKLIFGAIYSFSNTNHKAWPSIMTLADTVSAGRVRVRQGIKELEAAGVINVQPAKNGGYIFYLKPTMTVERTEEVVLWDDEPAKDDGCPGHIVTRTTKPDSGSSEASGGPNMPRKDISKANNQGVGDKAQAPSPSCSSIESIYLASSLKARPLLLRDLTESAKEYRKKHFDEGWVDEAHRKNYRFLRDQIRLLEVKTYGCRISTI